MEYLYSHQVQPGTYETHGLDHDIPLRMHNDTEKEIRGSLRAQRDWTNSIKNVDGYLGNLGDDFSFMRVTVPECLPERLEMISYANEFAFLYDDAMEEMDLKSGPKSSTEGILEAFGPDSLNRDPSSLKKRLKNARPETALQVSMLAEMMAIDAPRALTTMKAWVAFVQSASRTRTEPFQTLDEYMPARIIDCGELIWYGTLTFGMGLNIPPSEIKLCMELAKPGYAALGLTNDLYSWEKERAAAERAGDDHVFNAVWVLMREFSVGVDEAKAMCRDETMRQIQLFKANLGEAFRGNPRLLSDDTLRYLQAVLDSYIGNLVWSIYSPRYKQF